MRRSEKSAEAIRVRSAPAGMATRLLEAGRAAEDKGPNGRESRPVVNLRRARHQKTSQAELPLEARGEAPFGQRSGEARTATNGNGYSGTIALMERVVERGNVKAALKRVRQNKGSPGVDGMTVDELPKYLVENWETIRGQLLDGIYQPLPVREVEIPKNGGGVRKLGIPSVLDRFIQQSILQALQPMFDPAQRHIQGGKRVVVDLDLEKFFDRVCHDVLMGRLEKRIGDKRMSGLIRRYLNAGIMANGVVMERYEGVPQGGPLTPPTQLTTFARRAVFIDAPRPLRPMRRAARCWYSVDHRCTSFVDLDTSNQRANQLPLLIPAQLFEAVSNVFGKVLQPRNDCLQLDRL